MSAVQAALQAARDKIAAKCEVTAERVVNEMALIVSGSSVDLRLS